MIFDTVAKVLEGELTPLGFHVEVTKDRGRISITDVSVKPSATLILQTVGGLRVDSD